jgi:hypothetical protein
VITLRLWADLHPIEASARVHDEVGSNGSQLMEVSVTEETSRRGVFLAAAGLGAVGLGAALATPGEAAAKGTEITLPPASEAVAKFRLAIPADALLDLRARLGATRWPEKETVHDWSEGVPLAKMKALANYWRSGYDMRRLERRLNAVPQYRTKIDGLGVHFLHVRSPHEHARPIILTHGWPGSIVEFLNVIGPLTNPTKHGGQPEDAFHVVLPSLPGFGFSDKPAESGWGLPRIARAWAVLMRRLGYTDYLAQGGDWGATRSSGRRLSHSGHSRRIGLVADTSASPPTASVRRQGKVSTRSAQEETWRPLRTKVFVVVLVEVAARSQGRQVHLVNGCSGDGCRGDAEFGSYRVDRVLGDVEVHPTVGGEIRADVALVVLLRFLAGQPPQERGDVIDGQIGLFDDRLEGSLVGPHQRLQRRVV